MSRLKAPYYYGDKKLGTFEANQCSTCDETEFTESAKAAIAAKAREYGIVTTGVSFMRQLFKPFGEIID